MERTRRTKLLPMIKSKMNIGVFLLRLNQLDGPIEMVGYGVSVGQGCQHKSMGTLFHRGH